MKTIDVMQKTKELQEKQLERTERIMKKTEELKHPTKKVMRIGSKIGCGVACGLIVTGGIEYLMGYPLIALGSVAAGTISLSSNLVCMHILTKKDTDK